MLTRERRLKEENKKCSQESKILTSFLSSQVFTSKCSLQILKVKIVVN